MPAAAVTIPAPASARPERDWARVAGLAYLAIIAAGIFAQFVVRGPLLVPGDAAATAANIAGAEPLFRAGFAADLVMLVCDAVVGVALYVLLRGVARDLALLALGLRLVHTAVLGANLLNHFLAVLLLGGGGHAASFAPGQADALALLFLDAHGYGYLIGQVFFGLHCLVLARLLWLSPAFPRALAAILGAGGAGYLLESFVRFLAPQLAPVTYPGLAAAVVAEVWLAVWLLVRAGRLGAAGSAASAPPAAVSG